MKTVRLVISVKWWGSWISHSVTNAKITPPPPRFCNCDFAIIFDFYFYFYSLRLVSPSRPCHLAFNDDSGTSNGSSCHWSAYSHLVYPIYRFCLHLRGRTSPESTRSFFSRKPSRRSRDSSSGRPPALNGLLASNKYSLLKPLRLPSNG